MTHTGGLSFRRIICRRCGEARIVGVVCPTCGEAPDPREVDPDRQRRTAMGARAESVLDDEQLPAASGTSHDPLALWPHLSELLDGFLGSLFEAVRDPSKEADLLAAIARLRQVEADAAAARRLRPWIATWEAVDEVIARLKGVARRYLSVIQAELPIGAQDVARLAQKELDEAADPAAKLGVRLDRWSRIEAAETVEQALAVAAEEQFAAMGAKDILTFDRAGDEVFHRVTGDYGCPVGLGFGLNIMAAQAEGPFDTERFWRVARATYQLLVADQQWLSNLVQDQVWLDDVKDALIRAWDAGSLHAITIAATRTERQGVRAVLSVGQDLVEGPGKRFVATILAASKSKTYGRYRDQSSGNLLIAASQDLAVADLILGVDRAIRTARAHEEFTVGGSDVVLKDRGVEVARLPLSTLVDRILAGVESINAMSLGILCAAVTSGIDVQRMLPASADLELPPEAAAVLILASSGWQGPEATFVGGALVVSGKADITEATFRQVASLLPRLPSECAHVTLRGDGPGGVHEVAGPTQPFRQWSEEDDELVKLALNVEAMRTWRLDGHPLVSEDQVRKLMARLTLQGLERTELPSKMRALRALLDLARRLGDARLGEVLAGVIGALRTSQAGLPSTAYAAQWEQLTAWFKMRVAPLPFGD